MKQLLQALQEVEKLASAGKAGRMRHNPLRYIQTLAFAKLVYPRSRRGSLKRAVTFFNCEMDVLLPASVDIYLTGGKTHDSEIRLARYMIRAVKEGDVIFDVGAHFGYFTLLAATLTGASGWVYAFEAAENTYSLLKKNTGGLKHIQALHHAVSDNETMIEFYEFPILYSEYNSINIEQFSDQRWIKENKPRKTEVRAVTIDLFTETIFKTPDFIKIDAEGAEDKVINGSVEVLKKYSPVVIMEFLSSARHNEVHFAAMKTLQRSGYDCHCINKAGELTAINDVNAYFGKTRLESDNFVFVKNNK